jgi:hypothetical protein
VTYRTPPANAAEVLARLEVLAAELGPLEERRDFLYEERTRLFHEGQEFPRTERATQAAMGDAASVSGTSVINALKRPPKPHTTDDFVAPRRPRKRRPPAAAA